MQDARLQQLIEAYRDRVRQAAREADDAATGLISALERERILSEAAVAADRSLTLANKQYLEGFSDFQRVLDTQRALFAQQDAYLLSRSDAVNSLIALYKALGGGWYSERRARRSEHARCDAKAHQLGRPARLIPRLEQKASANMSDPADATAPVEPGNAADAGRPEPARRLASSRR